MTDGAPGPGPGPDAGADGEGGDDGDDGFDLELDLTGDRDARARDDDPLVGDGEGGPGRDGDGDGEDTDVHDEAGEAEADDDGVEPVEVLVNLAEDGEIDPWDIDIVTVTDEFLARLDDADLRAGGRALFYASVLLRMKGDALLDDDDEEAETREPEPWEVELGMAPPPEGHEGPGAGDAAAGGPDPVAGLEREMERRLDRKSARGTPETLDDLVRELREAERDTWWKESREYDTSDSPSGHDRGVQTLDYRAGDDLRADEEPTAADVTDTAHAEDLETATDDVWAALEPHFENGRAEVLFREISGAAGSRVETYLGTLFLAHRGRVELRQDEFFGDLWVGDPDAPEAGGEEPAGDADDAVAD